MHYLKSLTDQRVDRVHQFPLCLNVVRTLVNELIRLGYAYFFAAIVVRRIVSIRGPANIYIER